jgi:hypothetical protein
MGISGWTSLLVYQWDDLPGPGAKKLAKEDENMPTMQSVPNHVAYLRCGVRDGLPYPIQIFNNGGNFQPDGYSLLTKLITKNSRF